MTDKPADDTVVRGLMRQVDDLVGQPRVRRITVGELPVSLDDLDGPLLNLRDWAEALIAAVPVDQQSNARVSFDNPGDHWASLFVYYERPETEDDRKADELQRRDFEARRIEEDRRQYERLKAKFEGT